MDGTIWQVRERLDESFRRVLTLLSDMEREEDSPMRLASARELRLHIALAEKALVTATRKEKVREFEESVFEVLDGVDADLRHRVLAAMERKEQPWSESVGDTVM